MDSGLLIIIPGALIVHLYQNSTLYALLIAKGSLMTINSERVIFGSNVFDIHLFVNLNDMH